MGVLSRAWRPPWPGAGFTVVTRHPRWAITTARTSPFTITWRRSSWSVTAGSLGPRCHLAQRAVRLVRERAAAGMTCLRTCRPCTTSRRSSGTWTSTAFPGAGTALIPHAVAGRRPLHRRAPPPLRLLQQGRPELKAQAQDQDRRQRGQLPRRRRTRLLRRCPGSTPGRQTLTGWRARVSAQVVVRLGLGAGRCGSSRNRRQAPTGRSIPGPGSWRLSK